MSPPKASADTSWLPLAVAHGAEVRAECRVIDLERDGRGRVTAVVYDRRGQRLRQRCDAVFLCAGGVETPRLLLNLGLANSSGQVGRNFMAHVATQVWGRFDADMRMNRGYPSSLISEDMMRPADLNAAGGYLMQSLGVLPVTLATNLARGAGLWGQALVDLLDDYNRLGGIGINGECLPSDANRLTLSDETDAYGLRKARIDFSYGENERAIDAHARATMTAIWEAAGPATSWRWIAPRIRSARAGWASAAIARWSIPTAAASISRTCSSATIRCSRARSPPIRR